VLLDDGADDRQAQPVAGAVGAVAHVALLQGAAAGSSLTPGPKSRTASVHGSIDLQNDRLPAPVAQRVLHQVAQRDGERIDVAQRNRPSSVDGTFRSSRSLRSVVVPELLCDQAGELYKVDPAARVSDAPDSARDSCSSFSVAVAQHTAGRPTRLATSSRRKSWSSAVCNRRRAAASGVRSSCAAFAASARSTSSDLRQALQQAIHVVAHRAQLLRQGRPPAAMGRRSAPLRSARSGRRASCRARSSVRATLRSTSASRGSTGRQRNDQPEATCC
jgi:hypothetical protein